MLLLALLLFLFVFPHAERLQPDLPLSLFFRLAVLFGAIWALSDRRATRWVLALLGTSAYAVWIAEPEELARIRADALSTLLYLANWN